MLTAFMRKALAILTLVLVGNSLPASTLPKASGHQASGRKGTVPPRYTDLEGYQLMSLALEDEADFLKVKRLDLYKQSAGVSQLTICKELPKDFQLAADDLLMKSKTEVRFERKFTLAHPYRLTTDYGMTGFGVTVVGFDPHRTRAALAISEACGLMCGGGWTYLFQKTPKGWKKVGRVCEWMS
jgi:hypothetical protein